MLSFFYYYYSFALYIKQYYTSIIYVFKNGIISLCYLLEFLKS